MEYQKGYSFAIWLSSRNIPLVPVNFFPLPKTTNMGFLILSMGFFTLAQGFLFGCKRFLILSMDFLIFQAQGFLLGCK